MKHLLIASVLCGSLVLMVCCASSQGSSKMSDASTGATQTTTKRPTIRKDASTGAVDSAGREAALADARLAEAESNAAKLSSDSIREEQVKWVERSEEAPTGVYHIIVGSYKVLENARAMCSRTIEDGFWPSIMENDEGLYRVSIFTSDEESTARAKLGELRESHGQYGGMWLLKEKR